MELFRAVRAVNPILWWCCSMAGPGYPGDQQKSQSRVEVWRSGYGGGNAIVDVLTGKVDPSGKLPMSFPYCVGQVPVHYNEFFTGRPNRKGMQERFRSRYIDIPNAPLYPFGYGLSYTDFSVSSVTLDKEEMGPEDIIRAGVRIKNTGTRSGTETVQLYLRDTLLVWCARSGS